MFNLSYISYFFLILAVSAALTVFWRQLALRFKLLDFPDNQRKIHRQAIPLGGGWAIFLAFLIGLILVTPQLIAGDLDYRHWLGFLIGALILMIGGTLDDRFKLSPWQQIIFPLLAIVAVLLGGVEIARLSNPGGGIISLENINWLSSAIIIIWLLGMMYTTKLLDGVDGLVTGLGTIGAFIIFLFTSLTPYFQPDIALAALIFSAACLGFLLFNFFPASVFLGDGGSLLIGYSLGVLAIISGAKIAITLLIIGLPALDVAWTIIRRLRAGKNPLRFADRQHLHHRLLDSGFSQRQTALFYYGLAIFFGGSGLFLQSQGKILALLILFLLMLGIVIYFSYYVDKRPSLLFHICCAPCASYFSKEKLNKEFKLTWYFYNPNLVSQEEYDRRLQAVKAAAHEYNFNLIIEPYDPAPWQQLVQGREIDPERGERCRLCYRDRLAKTAKLAKAKGFSYFGSSLLVSPYKDSQVLKNIGEQLAQDHQLKFLNFDFQANYGFRRSYDFAKAKGWYLQKFCGCYFSQKKK